MAIDSKDSQTLPLIPPPKRGRGRPPKPDAMTPAERQAKRRAKLREEVANASPSSMTVSQALLAYPSLMASGDFDGARWVAKRLADLASEAYYDNAKPWVPPA